jgi:anti-anti-sigma regulatory factor
MQAEPSSAAGADQPTLLVDPQCGDGTCPPRIVLAGHLGSAHAGRLQQVVIDILRRQRPRRIDIDLGDVTVLDPSGIMALLLCQIDGQQVDCQIRLIGPRSLAYRALQLAGLLERFGLARPNPAEPALPHTVGAALGLVGSRLFR